MADGWITIGTELATDKFDKQIVDLEKKMKKEEDKKILLEAKLDTQEQDLEKAKDKVNELSEAYEKFKAIQDRIDQRKGTLTDFTQRIDLKQQYGSLDKLGTTLDSAYSKQNALEQKVAQTKAQYDGINAKVNEYKTKVEGIKLQKHQTEIDSIKKSLSDTGSGIQNIIAKVGRWSLAIFGVRAIYSSVRQAVSELSQYNDELAGKLEAIRLSLASVFAPLVEFIVNLVTKAVALLGFVLKSLFGIDIFARATAMSMKKATGSAKELKKQLAGFDEANVLNADGTTGIGGGISNAIDQLRDMNDIGEEVFRNIRRWFLGSDKNDFWGIWDDNMLTIKNFLGDIKETFRPLAEWIDTNVWQPIKTSFGVIIEKMKPLLEPLKTAWEELVEDNLKPLWDGFVKYIKPNVVDPMLKIFEPIGLRIYNFIVPYANKIIDLINRLFGVFGVHLERWEYKTEETTDDVEQNMKDTFENSENASDRMTNAMTGDLNEIGSNVDRLNNKEIDINSDTTEINRTDDGLQGLLNKLWELISHPWEIATTFTAKVGSSFNNLFSKIREGFSNFGISLPRMATGGIINMPNKGTMVGGTAIGGEAGREGVVPLTDQQAMAELGREIGKNVLVNLTNITTMNGRVIGRELKQVQSNQDFAFNT